MVKIVSCIVWLQIKTKFSADIVQIDAIKSHNPYRHIHTASTTAKVKAMRMQSAKYGIAIPHKMNQTTTTKKTREEKTILEPKETKIEQTKCKNECEHAEKTHTHTNTYEKGRKIEKHVSRMITKRTNRKTTTTTAKKLSKILRNKMVELVCECVCVCVCSAHMCHQRMFTIVVIVCINWRSIRFHPLCHSLECSRRAVEFLVPLFFRALSSLLLLAVLRLYLLSVAYLQYPHVPL